MPYAGGASLKVAPQPCYVSKRSRFHVAYRNYYYRYVCVCQYLEQVWSGVPCQHWKLWNGRRFGSCWRYALVNDSLVALGGSS